MLRRKFVIGLGILLALPTLPETRTWSSSGAMRWSAPGLVMTACLVVSPEKADQAANRKKRGSTGGRPVTYDAEQYKKHNTVERAINEIKAWRCLPTRYDKTPGSYLTGLQLRGSIIWLRSLRPA